MYKIFKTLNRVEIDFSYIRIVIKIFIWNDDDSILFLILSNET